MITKEFKFHTNTYDEAFPNDNDGLTVSTGDDYIYYVANGDVGSSYMYSDNIKVAHSSKGRDNIYTFEGVVCMDWDAPTNNSYSWASTLSLMFWDNLTDKPKWAVVIIADRAATYTNTKLHFYVVEIDTTQTLANCLADAICLASPATTHYYCLDLDTALKSKIFHFKIDVFHSVSATGTNKVRFMLTQDGEYTYVDPTVDSMIVDNDLSVQGNVRIGAGYWFSNVAVKNEEVVIYSLKVDG